MLAAFTLLLALLAPSSLATCATDLVDGAAGLTVKELKSQTTELASAIKELDLELASFEAGRILDEGELKTLTLRSGAVAKLLPEDLQKKYLRRAKSTTVCPWPRWARSFVH